jgi:hypothetical protein
MMELLLGGCIGTTAGTVLCWIAWPMPLLATVISVGMVVAPPWRPARSSNRASSAVAAPGGEGAGLEGVAPGPGTVTCHPGRVIDCETPFSPVTVTPLP